MRDNTEALLIRSSPLATKRRDPAGTLPGGQQQILKMASACSCIPAC